MIYYYLKIENDLYNLRPIFSLYQFHHNQQFGPYIIEILLLLLITQNYQTKYIELGLKLHLQFQKKKKNL